MRAFRGSIRSSASSGQGGAAGGEHLEGERRQPSRSHRGRSCRVEDLRCVSMSRHGSSGAAGWPQMSMMATMDVFSPRGVTRIRCETETIASCRSTSSICAAR